jgi:GTP cyclohydrolase IA
MSTTDIDTTEDLIKAAQETRYPSPIHKNLPDISNEDKKAYIAEHMAAIMDILGLDRTDPSLTRTPQRIAKMYVEEIFSGLDEENFPQPTFIDNNMCDDSCEMIAVSDISLVSFCEHHFLPIHGKAYVAYVPNKKIIGLSKINRIVEYFARRPQVQERLTAQIADSLAILLETEDIAVSIVAQHFCMAARGIKDHSSDTTTSVMRGEFKENPLRRQAFWNLYN